MGSHGFTCHPHTNHTCLYSPSARHAPSCGWYSLRLPTKGWPGWVDLGGWLHREVNVPHRELNPDTVTHPSTNRARRTLTSLIETNALPYARPPPYCLGDKMADDYQNWTVPYFSGVTKICVNRCGNWWCHPFLRENVMTFFMTLHRHHSHPSRLSSWWFIQGSCKFSRKICTLSFGCHPSTVSLGAVALLP